MATLGTKKPKERTETAGIALFGSHPRDPVFDFIEEGSLEKERISKDLQKLVFDTRTEEAGDNKEDEKPDKRKHYKTRKEPQRSDPVESENMINIADDTEIVDLTKKGVGWSSGGKEEKGGGLITTWKEIRTAAGTLPQKIRTIIVPLHKVLS